MEEDGPELWQVESLISALRIPRPTEIRRGRPPEPDVVFKHPLSGKSIGVEVTEIHPSGVEQRRREEEADRLVREAQRVFEADRGPSLQVGVFWADGVQFNKTARQELTDTLLETVRACIPREGARTEIDQCDDPRPDLPNAIDRLTVGRYNGVEGNWQCPRALYVPDVSHGDIDEALRRKNPKPKNHCISYNELWLLIVASGSGPSTWGLLKPELTKKVYETSYNRLFAMSRLELTMIELPTIAWSR